MAGTIIPLYDVEATISAKDPSAVLRYAVYGTEDETEVDALVVGELAAAYGGLPLQDYNRKHEGGGVWMVKATYGKLDPLQPTFKFRTTGGKTKITQSKETIGAFGLGDE